MDKELIELLGFWYIKYLDNNVSIDAFHNFINFATYNTEETLNFATFLKYIGISGYTAQLLKDNNDDGALGHTIRMLNITMNKVRCHLGGDFLVIQNELIRELKVQYQNEGLNPSYLEVIDRETATMNVGGRN